MSSAANSASENFQFQHFNFGFTLNETENKQLQTIDDSLDSYSNMLGTCASLGRHIVSARPQLNALIQYMDKLLPEAGKKLLYEQGIILKNANSDETFSNDKLNKCLLEKYKEANINNAGRCLYLRNNVLNILYDQIIPFIKKNLFSINQNFDPKHNGDCCLIDKNGNPVEITGMARESSPSTLLENTYGNKKAWEFIRTTRKDETPAAARERRQQLYAGLTCRTFKKEDIQRTGDEHLVGENAVFANRRYEKGEILGVYGGVGLKENDLGLVFDDSFFANIRVNEKSPFDLIDGTNVLSRINTVYELDSEGLPIAHATDGYNVDPTTFECSINQLRVKLPAYYAACIIEAGTELRVNYNTDPEAIDKLRKKILQKQSVANQAS